MDNDKLKALVEKQAFVVSLDPRDGGDTKVVALDDVLEALTAETPQGLSIQEIRGAVARGYCHEPNTGKEVDVSLLEAIAQEVTALLHPPASETGKPAQGGE